LEDVYVAQANDMIIITLQAEADEFDEYVEDFEAILTSFRPVE
jgi:predicted site-specific integrase-resolvase